MFSYRKLDDQNYENIIRDNRQRLPWLCPEWTDHNSSDPGITILELMAWYKEMQQYNLDQVTPDMYREMFKLLGMNVKGAVPAKCLLETGGLKNAHIPYSRIVSPQNIVFELEDEIPDEMTELTKLFVEYDRTDTDITHFLKDNTVFMPFEFGGFKDSALKLGFDSRPPKMLQLWFDICEPAGSKRNLPDENSRAQRILEWSLNGEFTVTPIADETWGLNFSGTVSLPTDHEWEADEDGIYWLFVKQIDGGCEERVRLKHISASRARAVQRESLVKQYFFEVEQSKNTKIFIRSAQALASKASVFYRTKSGWEQSLFFIEEKSDDGLKIDIDTSDAVNDNENNLMVVCMDESIAESMLFSTKGIPGEKIYLPLSGGMISSGGISLMCNTLATDGNEVLDIWKRIDDLSVAGPRDRVFVYDEYNESVIFGDGRHGAIPIPGEGSVMITEFVLTQGMGGNVPPNAGLVFESTDEPVRNLAAMGGCNTESIKDVRGWLMKKLAETDKCVSASDYEKCAMKTPGLRVAGAKAIAGFDPRYGRGQKRPAMITVIVLPGTDDPMPYPDERFLDAVNRQLDRYRTVCINVKAIPPKYVSLSVDVSCVVSKGFDVGTLNSIIRGFFKPDAAMCGSVIRKNDIMTLIQKLPGLMQIKRIEMRPKDQNSYRTETGDIKLPPDGLPGLIDIEFDIREG